MTLEPVTDGLTARIQSFDRALTVSDLAPLLGVSKSSLIRLCNQRGIPHFRLGKLVRFLPAKVAAWLEEKQAVVVLSHELRLEQREERGRATA